MTEELNQDTYSKIYIIESPGEKDLLSGLTEGKALSEVLKICNIDYNYYLVVSKECLADSLADIRQDIIDSQEDNLFAWPIIHISCHGNEDGIGLTNKEFINWTSFRELIFELDEVFDIEPVNPIFLSMSSCFGLHGIKIDWNTEKSPIAYVLGHEEQIRWDDGLVAFSSFYHNALNKKASYRESLECMNKSIGMANHFKLFNSKDLYNLMK